MFSDSFSEGGVYYLRAIGLAFASIAVAFVIGAF